MRLTTGSTSTKVGNAITQDNSQADGHISKKLASNPILRTVLIAEITPVINIDKTNDVAIWTADFGNLNENFNAKIILTKVNYTFAYKH